MFTRFFPCRVSMHDVTARMQSSLHQNDRLFVLIYLFVQLRERRGAKVNYFCASELYVCMTALKKH